MLHRKEQTEDEEEEAASASNEENVLLQQLHYLSLFRSKQLCIQQDTPPHLGGGLGNSGGVLLLNLRRSSDLLRLLQLSACDRNSPLSPNISVILTDVTETCQHAAAAERRR